MCFFKNVHYYFLSKLKMLKKVKKLKNIIALGLSKSLISSFLTRSSKKKTPKF